VRLILRLFAEQRVKRPSVRDGWVARAIQAFSRTGRCWMIRVSGSFQRAVSVRRSMVSVS